MRYATRSRRDARELELAKKVVAARHLALTLVYLNEHTRLFVGVCREDLRLLSWDSCVALDEIGHLPTGSLDTDGERGNVEQKAWVFSDVSPLRIAAWTAAPKATASSELIDLFGSVASH